MSDLPGDSVVLAEGPGRLHWAESPSDVVCLVKRFAADDDLSQEMGH